MVILIKGAIVVDIEVNDDATLHRKFDTYEISLTRPPSPPYAAPPFPFDPQSPYERKEIGMNKEIHW